MADSLFIFCPTNTSSCHSTIRLISFQAFSQCYSCRIILQRKKNDYLEFIVVVFFLLFSSMDIFLCECTGLKHSMSEVISSTNNVRSCLFPNSPFYFSFNKVTVWWKCSVFCGTHMGDSDISTSSTILLDWLDVLTINYCWGFILKAAVQFSL